MKRVVLGIPIVALATLFSVGQNLLNSGILPEVASLLVLWLSLSLIFLSLITYRMKDEVFHAWWNFALWWVPVIIATTLFFETKGGGGGGWGISSGLDEFVILWLLYIILIVTSLVKIVRAYLKTREI